MSFIDLTRKGWALRYLREARADLDVANKTSISAVTISRALSAMRKAQTAIYYTLGIPHHVGFRIYRAYTGKELLTDPLLRILVKLERIIRTRDASIGFMTKDEVLRDASFLIDVATDIVNAAIEEGA